MSAVSKEVGNKIHPASEMDDPLFHFEYGFSFISLKSSFLLTEFAALFSIVVYMAKRDERTFNRYKIRSLLKYRAKSMREKTQLELIQDCYTNHTTRFTRGRRAGISSPGSDIASFEEITSPIKLEKKRSEETSGAAQHPELLIPDFGKGDPRTKRHAEIKSESDRKRTDNSLKTFSDHHARTREMGTVFSDVYRYLPGIFTDLATAVLLRQLICRTPTLNWGHAEIGVEWKQRKQIRSRSRS
ncbi:hypothetical protein RB195_018885 [Necator americanus]|uniref:Uncharacterized protein n=1 Tax=Necator americanus TaxID=51031 RepID=A0ABR1CCR2_NECAM